MDETKILVTSTFNLAMHKVIYHCNLKSFLGKLLLLFNVTSILYKNLGLVLSNRWSLCLFKGLFRPEFRQEKFMFVSKGDVIIIIQEKEAEHGIRSEK